MGDPMFVEPGDAVDVTDQGPVLQPAPQGFGPVPDNPCRAGIGVGRTHEADVERRLRCPAKRVRLRWSDRAPRMRNDPPSIRIVPGAVRGEGKAYVRTFDEMLK